MTTLCLVNGTDNNFVRLYLPKYYIEKLCNSEMCMELGL